jgi:hypothetical protein
MPSGIYPEVVSAHRGRGAKWRGASRRLPHHCDAPSRAEPYVCPRYSAHPIENDPRRDGDPLAVPAPATDMWRGASAGRVARQRRRALSAIQYGASLSRKVTTGSFPVVTFNVSGPVDPRELVRSPIHPSPSPPMPGVGRTKSWGRCPGRSRSHRRSRMRAGVASGPNPGDVAQIAHRDGPERGGSARTGSPAGHGSRRRATQDRGEHSRDAGDGHTGWIGGCAGIGLPRSWRRRGPSDPGRGPREKPSASASARLPGASTPRSSSKHSLRYAPLLPPCPAGSRSIPYTIKRASSASR